MSDDVRIATALRTHRKTNRLKRRLGRGACWSLICLFLWAGQERWDGNLAGLTDDDIEEEADWEGEPGALIAALIEVRYLEGEAGSRRIHDWEEHNPFAASKGKRIEAGRTGAHARWGKKACEPHANRIATADDRTKPECPPAPAPAPAPTQPRATAKATVRQAALSPRFDEFWRAYPVHKAQAKAEAAWRRVPPALVDTILAKIALQREHDDDWLRGFAPHPTTYLNGKRWNDDIKKPGLNGHDRPRQPASATDRVTAAIEARHAARSAD